MDDPAVRTRETYDAIAARFLENARDRAAIVPWLDRFATGLPANARVLDLGAGPGMDSWNLRQRGLRAFGLDYSRGMLRVGMRQFPGPRLQADARHLPVASATLDGVWANASLLHLARGEIDDALTEIRRVLRAPGLLFVSLKGGTGAEWESDRYGQPRFFQDLVRPRARCGARACRLRAAHLVGRRDAARHLADADGCSESRGHGRRVTASPRDVIQITL